MPKMRNIFENDEDFIGIKLIGNGDTKIWYTPFPIEQIAKYQRGKIFSKFMFLHFCRLITTRKPIIDHGFAFFGN